MFKKNHIITVTHHIRNPIYVLRSYLEALCAGEAGELKGRQKNYLNACLVNIKKVESTIGQVLSAIELEEESYDFSIEKVDLVELVENIVDENKLFYKTTNTNISIYTEGDPFFVLADKEMLEKVVNTLFCNAIKYKRPGESEVDVMIKKEGKNVSCYVKDMGIGISKEDEENIFKKFYRGSKAIEIDPNGTGLDLYISKLVIEKLKGDICVKPREDTLGTVFSFRIPHFK